MEDLNYTLALTRAQNPDPSLFSYVFLAPNTGPLDFMKAINLALEKCTDTQSIQGLAHEFWGAFGSTFMGPR